MQKRRTDHDSSSITISAGFGHIPRIGRREFLGATAAVIAAARCHGTVGPRRPNRKPAKIVVGAHPWVYAARSPSTTSTRSWTASYADMRYAGLDGIDWMHHGLLPDDAVSRSKALSAEHRLPSSAPRTARWMWDPKQKTPFLENAKMVIARLAQVGADAGHLGGDAGGRRPPEEFVPPSRLLREVRVLCQRHGVVPNLHNHTYEVRDGMHDLRGSLERIPISRWVRPQLARSRGVDPATFIRQYKRQIVFLHLRDQKADGRWSEALGEGDMDYAPSSKAAARSRLAGDAVIELAHERDFQPRARCAKPSSSAASLCAAFSLVAEQDIHGRRPGTHSPAVRPAAARRAQTGRGATS